MTSTRKPKSQRANPTAIENRLSSITSEHNTDSAQDAVTKTQKACIVQTDKNFKKLVLSSSNLLSLPSLWILKNRKKPNLRVHIDISKINILPVKFKSCGDRTYNIYSIILRNVTIPVKSNKRSVLKI